MFLFIPRKTPQSCLSHPFSFIHNSPALINQKLPFLLPFPCYLQKNMWSLRHRGWPSTTCFLSEIPYSLMFGIQGIERSFCSLYSDWWIHRLDWGLVCRCPSSIFHSCLPPPPLRLLGNRGRNAPGGLLFCGLCFSVEVFAGLQVICIGWGILLEVIEICFCCVLKGWLRNEFSKWISLWIDWNSLFHVWGANI